MRNKGRGNDNDNDDGDVTQSVHCPLFISLWVTVSDCERLWVGDARA